MTTDEAPPPEACARQGFACAVCGAEAGLVQLFGPEHDGRVIRDSFTSRLTYRVGAGDFGRVRGIIEAGDLRALYDFDPEVACFYCPSCGLCYCVGHWSYWDVFDDEEGFTWHDSVRGRCPRGHERMLED